MAAGLALYVFAAVLAATAGAAEKRAPRYATSGDLTLVTSGAPIRDAFEGRAIDETSWRIWRSDPERLETWQKDGRYWIRISGRAGYNGLVSLATMETRDVVAVSMTSWSPALDADGTAADFCLGLLNTIGAPRAPRV